MPSRNTLEIIVQGEDRASNTLNKINGTLTSIGKVGFAAVAAGATAAGAAVTAFGAASLNTFINFENRVAEVFTLIPGASDEMKRKLEGDIQSINARFGFLNEKTIPAFYQAISAGVPSDNVLGFMQVASKAATGGVTELETAVDGITSVVNAYGSEVLSAQQASDLLFTAVRLGKTDFTQLSNSLFNVVPTAASLGIELDSITAALASMTAQGTPTSVATTQLRQLFVEASKDGTKLSDAIEKIYGVGFTKLIENGGDVAVILDKMRQELGDDEFRNMFGSVEALNAALGITGPNLEAYANNLEEMGNSAGATDQAFETMSQTVQFQIDRLRSKFETLKTEVGRRIAPFIVGPIEKIGDAISVVTALVKDGFGGIQNSDFGKFGNMVRDMLLDLNGLTIHLRMVGRHITETITGEMFNNSSVGTVIREGKTFFDNLFNNIDFSQINFGEILGNIFKVASLTTPLGALRTLLFEVFDINLIEIIGTFIDAIGRFLQLINAGVEPVTALGQVIKTYLGDEAKNAFDSVINAVNNFINNVFIPGFQAVVNFVQTKVIPAVNDFVGVLIRIWEAVKPGLEAIGNWFVNDVLPRIVGFITGVVIPSIGDFVGSLLELWEKVRPNLEKLANWFIDDILPQIVNFVQNTVLPIITDLIDIIVSIWTLVQPGLQSLADWFLTSALPFIVDSLVNGIMVTVGDFITLLQGIWEAVQGPLNDFKNGIDTIFSFIQDNIIQPVLDVINSIPDTFNRVKNEVSRIAGEVGGFLNNLNPFTGSGFLAGSPFGYANGLEYVDRTRIVKVHPGEGILTAEQNAARLNGNGGNTYNLNISLNGTFANQNEANQTADMFVRGLRQRGIDL